MPRFIDWARRTSTTKPAEPEATDKTATPILIPTISITAETVQFELPKDDPKPNDPEKKDAPLKFISFLAHKWVCFWTHVRDIICLSWINLLLVFVPIGLALAYTKQSPTAVFITNGLAVLPLAFILGKATEIVSRQMGDTVGAFLNVTFGNAVELIIFVIALVKDQIRIVQASLLGSILANLLLILGMAFFIGGLSYQEQIYNSNVTQLSACLLSLSVMSLLLPTALYHSFNDGVLARKAIARTSRGTSVVLLVVYTLYIIFQLKSHAHLYRSIPKEVVDEESQPGMLANLTSGRLSGAGDRLGDEGTHTPRSRRDPQTARLFGVSSPAPSLSQVRIVRASSLPHPGFQTIQLPDLQPKAQSYTHIQCQPSLTVDTTDNTRHVSFNPLPRTTLSHTGPIVGHEDSSNPTPGDLVQAPTIPPAKVERKSTPGTDEMLIRSKTVGIIALLVATGLVSLCGERLVDSIPEMLHASNVPQAFVGLIILPIIGNAAEHFTAVVVAVKNKMDLAIAVAVGSSIQISLLITPLVVILGWILGKEMTLFFNLFETVCLFVTTFIVNFLILNGRSNYLEGFLLIATYAIIAVCAFFYPCMEEQSLIAGSIKKINPMSF